MNSKTETSFFKDNFTQRRILDINPVSKVTKWRQVCVPNEEAIRIHKNIMDVILKKSGIPLSNDFASYRKSSPLENILKHRRYFRYRCYFPRYWYSMDLKSAYNNVDADRLTEVLRKFVSPVNLSENLKTYCFTDQGELITGANASSLLFYIYCSELIDQPMKEICDQHDLSYTRYRDDMLFSSYNPIGKRKRKLILMVIRGAGFEINFKKTFVHDLSSGSLHVNGIGVSHTKNGGRIFVPRKYSRHLRGILWNAVNGKGSENPSIIHGKMGAFLTIARKRRFCLNKTEKQILDMYHTFQEMERM